MVYAQIKAKLTGLFPQSPGVEVTNNTVVPGEMTVEPQIPLGVDEVYRRYVCENSNPLTCAWTQKSLEIDPTAKQCLNCGFPAILPPKTEIRGYRGRYRIDSFLGGRGMGRLYQGVQVADQQPVVIKEYLLPQRVFNQEETREKKQAFERLAGLSLADGRVQDIRLILPWDAISDPTAERCYLVTTGIQDTYPTLRKYLHEHGAMNENEVYHVLNQVLQTLQFLHGQKFSLPSGQVQQGIAHGNLSLDSLLLIAHELEFFTHVCDLAVWENLFELPNNKKSPPTFTQDLKNLGYIAFYLLSGKTVDDHNQALDPKIEQHWPPVRQEFQAFLFRLLELDKPFISAEEARQELIQITPITHNQVLVIEGEEETRKKFHPLYWLLLSVLGLAFLAGIIWLLIKIFYKPEVTTQDAVVCCLKDVPGVPPGKYNYTGEKSATWSYILQQSNLILQNQTLEEKFKESQPKLEINYQLEEKLETAIAKVQSGQYNFAVTNLVNQLPPQIRYKEFAYDGLVVFVAFSYSKRNQNLPEPLRGQISIEQLQSLYTGKIKYWNQLNPQLPKLRVNLYIPSEEEAVNIFKERVLKEPNAIDTFERLQKINNQQDTSTDSEPIVITRLKTLEMVRKILQDFENEDKKLGSIGFATLSQVFGQCSVYPLAIVDGKKEAVQALVQNDTNKPINPNTDLCDDKGSYSPNLEVFKNGTYPLSYPMVVVYLGDNSRPPIGQKFAEMLKTQEVQNLLEQTGLVPLQKNNK
ncbi:substrate-binding domain-containing protein [Aliinostoc sp. HNIBRCY26]|uniref:substrate-binding domain-containing protein n=1 Tax=Aliinostoc sp. HNIBRCY26 TaxID=3418997 RepID=UPI003D070F5B